MVSLWSVVVGVGSHKNSAIIDNLGSLFWSRLRDQESLVYGKSIWQTGPEFNKALSCVTMDVEP